MSGAASTAQHRSRLPKTVQLLAKAASKGQQWREDDALDAMFFIRVAFAAVLGLVWGVVGAQGLLAFLTYIISSILVGSMWIQYQNIDTEEWEGQTPIAMEGFAQGISLFVLFWVVTYSLLHF